jgi:hypothetical protein
MIEFSEADPRPAAADPEAEPRSRAWFVVLTWITLILFGVFIVGVIAAVVFVPWLRQRGPLF